MQEGDDFSIGTVFGFGVNEFKAQVGFFSLFLLRCFPLQRQGDAGLRPFFDEFGDGAIWVACGEKFNFYIADLKKRGDHIFAFNGFSFVWFDA